MRLISFRINSFKSIIDTGETKISDIDNITVLAGQNETGKSAALEALDFFKNGPGPDFVKLQKRMDSPVTEVICKFLLSQDDIRYVQEGFGDERITKFFNESKVIEIKRVWSEEDNVTEDLIISGDYFASFEFENIANEEINNDDSTIPTIIPNNSLKKEDIITIFEERLITRIPVVTLYRSFTDLLPSEILVSNIPTNAAVKDFEKVFDINLAQTANISDERQLVATLDKINNKATDDFNKSWSQQLSLTDDTKYQFVLHINQQEPKKVNFMIKGTDNTPLYLEQKSMGFRWFSAFHLRLRAIGADETNLNNLVLLVDEPGQNLHEKAQLDAKNILEELASKGAQIIYSTHNAKLIGTQGKEFIRIRLVSNSKEKGTKIETVTQFASRVDRGNMDALSPVITAMGISSIGSFVDRERFNVVLEGITDHYYFSAFKKLCKKEEKLYFVPACGVNNLPNLVSILMGWGFNYKAVFDDDPDSGRKAYNLLKKEFYENDDVVAHHHILKIKNCNGIEDIFTPADFKKFVLGETTVEDDQINSKLANGRKEILARQFLEKVENGEEINLEPETVEKINEIFDWLYEKFEITS